ncbi:ATP-binding cassette domain-containing protein [Tychonema sp. LEGE 07203]|uniref:ATP-binding cassette domain-containing protein n=1 Tax=Tychonema sp. LEGE 07203 TaxID=1828671 RepID=UPI001D14BB1F|nr:ATP-binding cassette domain-containing protein [Tychonema sp. LEGE 07203]
MIIFSLRSVEKDFGIKELLTDASFSLDEEDKVGLVGTNGSGKSTLQRSFQYLLSNINSSLHRPVFISLCVLCVLAPVKSPDDATVNDISRKISQHLSSGNYPCFFSHFTAEVFCLSISTGDRHIAKVYSSKSTARFCISSSQCNYQYYSADKLDI